MKFKYSNKKLFSVFLTRLTPSLLFWYFALIWGNVFLFISILLTIEAIIEVLWLNFRGYLTIDENQIQKHLLLITDKLSIEEIDEVFVYDNEWTFTPNNKKIEIKLFKNYVSHKQQEDLNEVLDKLWENFRNYKNPNIEDSKKSTE